MAKVLNYLIYAIVAAICFQLIDLGLMCLTYPDTLVNYLAILCFAGIPSIIILTKKLLKK